MSTTVVDWILGLLLLGSWFDCIGIVLELMLIVKYFSMFGWKDHWFIKYAVVAVTCVDIVSVITVCEWVYIIGIKHFGEIEYLAKQGVQLPIHNILVSFTACVTQVYLAWRFYKISKNMVIFIGLLALSATAYGGAIYISYVQLHAANTLAGRDLLITAAYIWLACEAACDIAVSTALVFYLLRFKSRTRFQDTKGMITRLVRLALESGAFTSVFAIATLLATSLKLDSNVCLMFVFVLGRVYGCTFIYNLNIRQSALALPGAEPYAGASGHSAGRKGGSNRVDTLHLNELSMAQQTVQDAVSGINVQREKTVFVDTSSRSDHESKENLRF